MGIANSSIYRVQRYTFLCLAATLYLIATPIGNLEDITLRALRILREQVDLIACEDTRQTHKLLAHYEIRKPLLSYHEHNEASRASEILERLTEGQSVALVSDAGTPLISDPGYRVVTVALKQGIAVVPIPGPSAILAALAGSGLPVSEFRFVGFLPSKSGARRKILGEIAADPSTVVLYETPHRVVESLSEMAEIFGDRPITVARELTKIHEEFLRGTAASVREQLRERDSVRGEITVVIGPSKQKSEIVDPFAEVSRLQHEEGLDWMGAIKTVAKRMRVPKREIYRICAEQGSNRAGKDRG